MDDLTSPHENTGDGLRRRRYDVVVVGAGVAGLAFTLRRPPELRVALLTKGVLGESNTRYAQGGLAAAVGADDAPALHEADTLAAGAGLCDEAAVRRLVEDAPAAVEWLVGLGARFDSGPAGAPLLGLEAAHSRHRVLHAGGDATGAEIERALVAAVRRDPNVAVLAGAFALDLVVAGGRCRGVVAQLAGEERPVALEAPVTVLAAGGAGQLWATTSNPRGATADGLAMALRAGVTVADVEFVQFHPTVLHLPGTTPFLVSEAVRGEGAYLRGADGERFMVAVHPLAELAPRDVVARGIQRQMARDERDHVSLDLRHLEAAAMRARFPTIARELSERGLDLATNLIPVAPAAHYFIGGVAAGTDGTTSLPGLLALGEAACTGVNGANRLASNSLLEGLVFGLAAAATLEGREHSDGPPEVDQLPVASASAGTTLTEVEIAEFRVRLQATMSRHVAVVRDAAGLAEAAGEIAGITARLDRAASGAEAADAEPGGDEAADAMRGDQRSYWEVRSMATAAAAIVEAARRREESRGAHFRSDFPEANPDLSGRHTIFGDDRWRFGELAAAIGGDRRRS